MVNFQLSGILLQLEMGMEQKNGDLLCFMICQGEQITNNRFIIIFSLTNREINLYFFLF